MNRDQISSAVLKLADYIEAEQYRGYDPYDALKSRLFRLPVFRNRKIRFLSQQLVKRMPFNLRPLLGIQKGYNPVTLGLCIRAYSNQLILFPGEQKKINEKISYLVEELERMVPSGYSGACWGYDFDWESRHAAVPAFQPTVVATGIITDALFRYALQTGNKKSMALCTSAAEFILKDLRRTYDTAGNNFCFSYSPFDHEMVFNASMKGARLLAQVYSQTKNEALLKEAQKAVTFVMNHQFKNGSWIYSKSDSGKWVDNYHTAYVLDCLDEYMKCTGDRKFQSNLDKGLAFYRRNFFTPGHIPKFYADEIYPVDCTAAGQSMLTLTRFGDSEQAGKVAAWMIDHMQSKRGYFYFRRFKRYTVKTSFMRWSNAWMFAGLTEWLVSNQPVVK